MVPRGWSNSLVPLKNAIATGTGRASGDVVNVTARRNSFQTEMNTRIAVVAKPGTASGRMTFRKATNGVAPSIYADSSSSRGISLKNDVSV
ncbi:hypothetical protein D3C87_1951410 [compost metagenome]